MAIPDHRPPMELRHLRYFVAVAEEKSFTRAAARLRMRQPPLSQQIKMLEREIGVRLFERLPKGVELTAGGVVFLTDAQATLAGVERAAQKAVHAANGIEGALSVGFTSSVASHHVAPDIILRYSRSYPHVALTFHEGNAADLTEAIARGDLDVAVVRAPVAQPPNLLFHTLFNEEMLVALPLKHELVRKRKDAASRGISLRALANEPFILVRRPGAPGMYANLIAACNRVGFSPRIAAEVGHMLTNIMLVAAGVGVSVVPASMRGTHAGLVAYCRLKDSPKLVAPVTLIHKQENTNPAVSRFVASTQRLAGLPSMDRRD